MSGIPDAPGRPNHRPRGFLLCGGQRDAQTVALREQLRRQVVRFTCPECDEEVLRLGAHQIRGRERTTGLLVQQALAAHRRQTGCTKDAEPTAVADLTRG